MGRLFRVDGIGIKTVLTAEEAYDIARKYHDKHHISGIIPSDIHEAVYLDECQYITKDVTWMICSKFEPNCFEGMDRLTIMVLDKSKWVCGVLDHNDIPIIKNGK